LPCSIDYFLSIVNDVVACRVVHFDRDVRGVAVGGIAKLCVNKNDKRSSFRSGGQCYYY
jgi:hypothetical protein